METPTVVDEILRSQSGDCPDFLRSENESIITSDRSRELQQGSCEIPAAVRSPVHVFRCPAGNSVVCFCSAVGVCFSERYND